VAASLCCCWLPYSQVARRVSKHYLVMCSPLSQHAWLACALCPATRVSLAPGTAALATLPATMWQEVHLVRLPAACHCADAVLGMRTAKHAQQPTACLRCACPPDTDQAITCEDMRACAVADVATCHSLM
jgi:hypothetical protein